MVFPLSGLRLCVAPTFYLVERWMIGWPYIRRSLPRFCSEPMRRPRLLAPESLPYAIYHCVSRVVDRSKVFGDIEKEQFVEYMRLYERLFGLRVLTYCLMGNHFHILVEVPRRPTILPGNDELIALVRATHGDVAANNIANWFMVWDKQKNVKAMEQERERWFRQMWSLAGFMKVLKQRFTQWYNGRQPIRRTGTLWEDRYRSVLVENGAALRAMAAYIDLNPVRAGLVKDPKEYRWSGYGEACAGETRAMEGLRWMASQADPAPVMPVGEATDSGAEPLDWYREQLFSRGAETRDAEGRVTRTGFSEQEIQSVRTTRGRLPMHEYIRLRIRYFTDGAILGTEAFVESVFQARRTWFSPKRRTGSRRLQGLETKSPLRVARALAIKPFG
jgi:putative transposase